MVIRLHVLSGVGCSRWEVMLREGDGPGQEDLV